MADPLPWISALRASHERLAAALLPLDEASKVGPSYDTEWTIAQVASHLGSQAEIFGMFLAAGLAGTETPGNEAFGPVWDRWNAKSPSQQVVDCVAADEAFLSRIETVPADQQASFALTMFGMDLDLAGLTGLRLGEHALHTWDIVVAFDPGAVLSADATALLVDTLPARAAQLGKPTEDARVVVIGTSHPDRAFRLTTGPEVEIAQGAETSEVDVALPAEALVRLVFGRLDPEHTPAGTTGEDLLPDLRTIFPGF